MPRENVELDDSTANSDENFDNSNEADGSTEDKAGDTKTEALKDDNSGDEPKAEKDEPQPKKPNIAAGDEEPKEKPAKPLWPEDWRHQIATRVAAGDKKAYNRELKRLERIADPSGIYGMYREAEGKLTSGNLTRIPGKDATPEEIAQFHKAIGIPDDTKEYIDSIKLANGAEIGDDDKVVIGELAEIAKKNGTTPPAMNDIVNWYFSKQEEQAAALDESDDEFRRATEQELKEEYGAAFKRKTSGIPSLFATAPGGADPNNESSLFNRLLGGRMADGQIIGNDPDMVRFLVGLSHEINPATLVLDDTTNAGQTIDSELEELRALRKSDRRKYFSKEIQEREQELIAAQLKLKERG
jgi:hypothetical protein